MTLEETFPCARYRGSNRDPETPAASLSEGVELRAPVEARRTAKTSAIDGRLGASILVGSRNTRGRRGPRTRTGTSRLHVD